MTNQELLVKAHKVLDKACDRYARNPTEENFQKALRAEERANKIEDEYSAQLAESS